MYKSGYNNKVSKGIKFRKYSKIKKGVCNS